MSLNFQYHERKSEDDVIDNTIGKEESDLQQQEWVFDPHAPRADIPTRGDFVSLLFREGVEPLKFTAGETKTIRVLPPGLGQRNIHFATGIKVLNGIGGNLNTQVLYDEQQVLKEQEKYAAYADRRAQQYAALLTPQDETVIRVIVRGEEAEGVRIWKIPNTMKFNSQFFQARMDEWGDFQFIDDVYEGRDIEITTEQREGYMAYSKIEMLHKSVLTEDKDEGQAWLNTVQTPTIESFNQLELGEWLDLFLATKRELFS